jgi:hypothetical protein
MRSTLFLASLLALLSGSVHSLHTSKDHCSQLQNAADCTSAQDCGWCSTPVHFKDGSLGPHCMPLNSTSMPYGCTGTFSTGGERQVQQPGANTVKQGQSVNCPAGSTLLMQWTSDNFNCSGFVPGSIADCMASGNCSLWCSGYCVTVPFLRYSYMWQCNGGANGTSTNATLTDYWSSPYCTDGSPGWTYPVDDCCEVPFSAPTQYSMLSCVPCGEWCQK